MVKKPKVSDADMVLEVILELWMELYNTCEEVYLEEKAISEELFARFKNDYEIAVEEIKKMHRQTKGEFRMQDLYQKLPGNLWLSWQREVLTREAESYDREEARRPEQKPIKSFRQLALERKYRKDVM